MNMSRAVTVLRATTAAGLTVALSLTAAPGARAAAGGPAGPAVRGLDVSADQHKGPPIDWLRISRLGFKFVGIKASEGTYYHSPYYQSDARAATAAGLAVLPYVFANPRRAGGRATASFAASVTGTLRGPARLPFVVDLENDPYQKADNCYGRRVPVMIEWITGFIAESRRLTGKWPVIYTTDAWWRQCTGATTRFRPSPLWLASFGTSVPSVPAPWHQWAFWQYADNGSLPGLDQVDLDYYRPTDGLPDLRGPGRHQPRATPSLKQHKSPRTWPKPEAPERRRALRRKR